MPVDGQDRTCKGSRVCSRAAPYSGNASTSMQYFETPRAPSDYEAKKTIHNVWRDGEIGCVLHHKNLPIFKTVE
jgi:hypothetical protein